MAFPEIPCSNKGGDPKPGSPASARAALVRPSRWRGGSSSRHDIRRPRMTATPPGAQGLLPSSQLDELVDLVDDFWDGIVTNKPTFPLSEIAILKHCNFSARFYIYARLNGRAGVILKSLIEDILDQCTAAPDVGSEPEPEQGVHKNERSDTKGKGKPEQLRVPQPTSLQGVPPAIGPPHSGRESEIQVLSMVFERACGDLKDRIGKMETAQRVDDVSHETRACVRALKAMSERARKLREQSPDPKTSAVARGPELCGRPPPGVAKSEEVDDKSSPSSDEPLAKTRKKKIEVSQREKRVIAHLKQLQLEYRNRHKGGGGGQQTMSYSGAVKAAVRHYTFSSAYPKPSEGPGRR